MRRRNNRLTESQMRYLRESHRRNIILEQRIDQIVDEEISKSARNWLLGGAAAAGLAFGGQGQSDADMINMDHLMTVKQGIEMEYNKPIEEIPPHEIQYFYDECEKYGIDPEDVR